MWWKHGPSQLLTVSQAETPDILTGSGAEETSDGGNSSRCCFTSPDYTERWSCCSTHEHTVNIRFHYLHSKLSGAAAPSPAARQAARQPGSPAGSRRWWRGSVRHSGAFRAFIVLIWNTVWVITEVSRSHYSLTPVRSIVLHRRGSRTDQNLRRDESSEMNLHCYCYIQQTTNE